MSYSNKYNSRKNHHDSFGRSNYHSRPNPYKVGGNYRSKSSYGSKGSYKPRKSISEQFMDDLSRMNRKYKKK